ncbi:MAG: flagellar biosynthesis anti-sigma factor FlgM [Novosphingobium sp.]
MPTIEPVPLRPVQRIEPPIQPATASVAATPQAPAKAEPGVVQVRSEALDPGPEPFDGNRVAQIRKALETGNYPITPITVADTIIAAGMVLRFGE